MKGQYYKMYWIIDQLCVHAGLCSLCTLVSNELWDPSFNVLVRTRVTFVTFRCWLSCMHTWWNTHLDLVQVNRNHSFLFVHVFAIFAGIGLKFPSSKVHISLHSHSLCYLTSILHISQPCPTGVISVWPVSIGPLLSGLVFTEQYFPNTYLM